MAHSNAKRGVSIAVSAAFLCGLLFPAAPRAAAAAEKVVYRTLPAGATIVGILQSTVSTKRNKVGDPVKLRTAHPIRQGGQTVVPSQSTLVGEVTHAKGPGRIAGGAELTLRFHRIVTPDGRGYEISTDPIRLEGKGSGKESAEEIGGGAAAGGVLGGVLGGGKGVLKGAAAGAVVGTGVAVATKGKQIVLPAGQRIRVTLRSSVTLRGRPGPA
jgi:hypothetical protein